MVSVQTVFSRPSTEVPWYHTQWEPAMITYVNEIYESTDKVNGLIHESTDGLTLTILHVFTTVEDQTEWDTDTYLNGFREIREDYNDTNGILLVSRTES